MTNLSTPASPYKNATRLILVSVVACFMTGCFNPFTALVGPKYKVGDCLQPKKEETWLPDERFMYREVIGIGKKHYQMVYGTGTEIPLEYADFSYIDNQFEKVPCRK